MDDHDNDDVDYVDYEASGSSSNPKETNGHEFAASQAFSFMLPEYDRRDVVPNDPYACLYGDNELAWESSGQKMGHEPIQSSCT